jgi:proteasome lid subunit RPN8/RPN11
LLGEVKGQDKLVHHVMETENDAEGLKRKRYRVPPKSLLAAENLSREKGWEVFGVYHSHPDHPAKPSDFDRERAIPYFEYIIVSISKGHITEISCWFLAEEKAAFKREELLVSD